QIEVLIRRIMLYKDLVCSFQFSPQSWSFRLTLQYARLLLSNQNCHHLRELYSDIQQSFLRCPNSPLYQILWFPYQSFFILFQIFFAFSMSFCWVDLSPPIKRITILLSFSLKYTR